MEFRILGPLEVLDEGHELPLGPAKERAVLGVLLLHAGSVVSRTQLIDGLWGGSPPPTAAKAVNVYVSQARRTLSRNGGEPIVTRPLGYVLDLNEEQLDATRFQRLATAAREREQAGELEAAAALMREALGLWRGAALAGLELEGDALTNVARLEELRLAAELDLVDYQLALGEHEHLIAELERLVAQHPLDERLRGQLILALYRSGRQVEALSAYRETREILVETLGIEPSLHLQRLERGILNHDSVLQAPAGTARREPYNGPSTAPVAPSRSRRRRSLVGSVLLASAALAGAVGFLIPHHGSTTRFHDVARNSVGVIDPKRDQIVADIPVGIAPTSVASDASSVWVANNGDGTVSQIDPNTNRVVRTVSVPGVQAVAAGSDALWVTGSVGYRPTFVARIDPTYGVVTRTLYGEGGPLAVRDGTVWTANKTTLLAIDELSARIKGTYDLRDRVNDLASEPGDLWVAGGPARSGMPSYAQDGFPIYRLNEQSGTWDQTLATGATANALGVGAGAVWAAMDNGVVLRIASTTGQIRDTVRVGSSPSDLVVGGGAVWVADRFDRTISKIDPRTDSVIARIRLGHSPDALAFAQGRLWVTVY